jgi:threonine dehydrogenase-like Zn-dependent dehydrogenase
MIVDPRGAHTTGATQVAKVYETYEKKELGTLEGKKAVVLAGTGPVGQVCCKLLALEGADVYLTSRKLEKAKAIARKLNEELDIKRIKGIRVSTDEERIEAVKGAEVILATGTAGVQLLPFEILKNHARECKVIADVNAVPPYGIEGLKPTDDMIEVLPGVFGIGAIVIGSLKNEIEVKLIEDALAASKGVFDYKVAYKVAKSLVR